MKTQPTAVTQKQQCTNMDRQFYSTAVAHHHMALHLGDIGMLHLS